MAICPRCGAENGTYMSVCSACTQTENLIKGQQEIFQQMKAEQQQSQNNFSYDKTDFSYHNSNFKMPSTFRSFMSDLFTFGLLAVAFGVIGFVIWQQLKFLLLFFR